MENIRDVLRREIKYRVSQITAMHLTNTLGGVLYPDSHNLGQEGYMVRSLYFDSIYDSDFFDKIDGVERRKKIRLRLYSPYDLTAKLEIKEKNGDFHRKRSLAVSRGDALSMISGDYGFLKNIHIPLAEELYLTMTRSVYLPKCIVQYRRLAFTLPVNDVRITLDARLEAGTSCFDLFSPSLCLHPVCSYDDATLEVKYNRFLFSYVKELLACNKFPVAYSKYCASRMSCSGSYHI